MFQTSSFYFGFFYKFIGHCRTCRRQRLACFHWRYADIPDIDNPVQSSDAFKKGCNPMVIPCYFYGHRDFGVKIFFNLRFGLEQNEIQPRVFPAFEMPVSRVGISSFSGNARITILNCFSAACIFFRYAFNCRAFFLRLPTLFQFLLRLVLSLSMVLNLGRYEK
jgi:hypothetical protein